MILNQLTNLYAFLRAGFPTDLTQSCLQIPEGASYSYADIEVLSAQLAVKLRHCLAAVSHQPRVLVQVDKSPQAVALYLACLRAGLVYVPLNTAYTLEELHYFIADLEPDLVICAPEQSALLAELAAQGVASLSLGAAGEGSLMADLPALTAEDLVRVAAVAEDDLACIIYTSGTTGRAKGAMLSHASLRHNLEALYQCWDWRRDDVLIHALPIFHVHGLFVALHLALRGGNRLWFLARFDVDTVLALLPQASVLMGVPTFYSRLLQAPALQADSCQHLRLCISGSAPLLAATHEAFAARTGLRILERYGMSEAGIIASNPEQGERLAGSVGFALPGVSCCVLDADGQPLPAGSLGRVAINSPGLMQGYWRQPEATAASFHAGWFLTGDLGRLDADGRLWLLGRDKDLIIRGGLNIYPKEIELCLDGLPGVLESAVVGVPDADYGEVVVAFVVAEPQARDAQQLLAQLAPLLARFKWPQQWRFVDELPRNSMGKVQKNQLRQQCLSAGASLG